MTAIGALCRLTAFPRSCPTARGPFPDSLLSSAGPGQADVRLTTPKQTHADLCCFFNAVDHLAKSNGYLQHPLGSFRRLGEVAARQPTMYPASDAAVG